MSIIGVLVTYLVVMTKYLDKANYGEKRFILAHSSSISSWGSPDYRRLRPLVILHPHS